MMIFAWLFLLAAAAAVVAAAAAASPAELVRERMMRRALAELPPFAHYLAEYQLAVRFVVDNMPSADLITAPSAMVTPKYIAQTCMSRTNAYMQHWKQQVPFAIFLEFVLPYAVLSEPRDTSLDMLDALEAYLSAYIRPTVSETALLLNYAAFDFTQPRIEFQAAKPNQVNAYSPQQVIQAKRASCTGESVFLVYCLRVLGIPARVAGVPHWNRPPALCPDGIKSPACGNHNWVEVYLGDGVGWAFLDQNTRNAQWNRAFFFPKQTDELPARDASRVHAVFASTWNRTQRDAGEDGYFPLVFDAKYKQVSAIDHTAFYHQQQANEVEYVEVM